MQRPKTRKDKVKPRQEKDERAHENQDEFNTGGKTRRGEGKIRRKI
jgi:hypothetical protein